MNPKVETNKHKTLLPLEDLAEQLSCVLGRLDKLEKVGEALAARCQNSETTRVCMGSLLPQLKDLYPEFEFFVGKKQ